LSDEVVQLIGVQVHELVHVCHGIGAGVLWESRLTDHGAPKKQAKVFVEMSNEKAAYFRLEV